MEGVTKQQQQQKTPVAQTKTVPKTTPAPTPVAAISSPPAKLQRVQQKQQQQAVPIKKAAPTSSPAFSAPAASTPAGGDAELAAFEHELDGLLYPAGSPLPAPHGLQFPFPILHESDRMLYEKILVPLPKLRTDGQPAFDINYPELDRYIEEVEAMVEQAAREAGIMQA
jgi:hypothetical protein